MSPTVSPRDRRRWTIGVAISDDCRYATAAALAAYGSSCDGRADVGAAARVTIPAPTRRLFRELTAARPRRPASMVPVLSWELAEAAAACVHKLAAREPGVLERSLLLVVWAPCLWRDETTDERACLGLCDAARLAELTGLNVLDDLAARDLALGGRGGPLFAVPDWLSLRDPDHGRAVIHPGIATEITLLPASRAESSPGQVQSVSSGLGPGLVGPLLQRLRPRSHHSAPASTSDSGWISALLDDWAADGTVAAALAGEWRPPTPASAALIDALVRCASERGIAATDAVRTLIRLVACGIADLIAAAKPRPAEAVLAAGGRVGRWLQRDLSELLPEARFLAASDIGFPPRVLDAAATAWWGQLYLDQTPANLPTLTGARAPRVLGRFTPGAPQQFLRLTRLMAASQPVVSLRTAI